MIGWGGGHPTAKGQKRKARRVLVGKHQRARPLSKPRRSWKNKIKVGLKQRGLKNVDWINRARHTNKWFVVENTVIDLRSTTGGKFVDSVTMNLSGMTQAVGSYLPSNMKARLNQRMGYNSYIDGDGLHDHSMPVTTGTVSSQDTLGLALKHFGRIV